MATTAKVLKYTMLPGIIPRVLGLFRNGFSYVAYLMAVIYTNVRLLPGNHPYNNPANIGRFGVRHVLAEASSNLKFTRKNIDQIIIYFSILSGMIALSVQIVLTAVALFATQPVLASSPAPAPLPHSNFTELFLNNEPAGNAFGARGPKQDIAFMLLDQVFGTSGIFESCVEDQTCYAYYELPANYQAGNALGPGCTAQDGYQRCEVTYGSYPWPFHVALHKILEVYSSGVFLVGVFVILYFLTTIVLETAQSGTPFGKRYNKAWVPIRLIIFFALIIPIGSGSGHQADGMNGGQLLVLSVSKLGSNFATNAWSFFTTGGNNGGARTDAGLSNSFLSQNKKMVAQPNVPRETLLPLLQMVNTVQACRSAYQLHGSGIIEAYIVRTPLEQGQVDPGITGAATNAALLKDLDYDQALAFSKNSSIMIRVGKLGQEDPATGKMQDGYAQFMGGVKPYCGSLTIPISAIGMNGADFIQRTYYEMIQDMWEDTEMIAAGSCIVKLTTGAGQIAGDGAQCQDHYNQAFVQQLIDKYYSAMSAAVTQSIENQNTNGDFDMPDNLIERGWAGAAVWYNKIAQMNGAVTAAAQNMPKADMLPMLLREAQNANRMLQRTISQDTQFSQNVMDINDKIVDVMDNATDKEKEMLNAMRDAHEFWSDSINNGFIGATRTPTGNIVIDTINAIFGTSGLFDMRNNDNVHPLAKLSAIGKGIIDATSRNVVGAVGLAGAAGLAKSTDKGVAAIGHLADGLSGFLFSVVVSSIGIGVVMYYVLPFMPFIYFFFATSGWLKSVFEAIIAVPLWALSHIRIDGEGLPGPGAVQGYFLLLEVFLRPVLIVIGFLASITIFSALVDVLDQVFDLVVASAGGFDYELEAKVNAGILGMKSNMRYSTNPVDEFFYTAMYAIICYMMGLASFKLVDQIPNNILRWMNSSVTTFQENAGDTAGKLSSDVYRGTQLVARQGEKSVSGNLPLLLG